MEAEAAAKEAGLPSDIRINLRTGAKTGCSKGWVIQPDGTDRDRDYLDARTRHQTQGPEVWQQILPGELVLQWQKACRAAEHEFTVIYRPATLTPAQLERVEEILEQIRDTIYPYSPLEPGEGWKF